MSDNQQKPGTAEDASGTAEANSNVMPAGHKNPLDSLDREPDLAEVLADPTYIQLELFTELFHPLDAPERSKKRAPKNRIIDIDDAQIIEQSKNDLLYLAHLTELLRRVRKGRISLETLKSLYSEKEVKVQIMACLNLRMDMGGIPEEDLKSIITGLVTAGIMEASEIVLKSEHPELSFAVRKLYSISGQMPAVKPPQGASGMSVAGNFMGASVPLSQVGAAMRNRIPSPEPGANGAHASSEPPSGSESGERMLDPTILASFLKPKDPKPRTVVTPPKGGPLTPEYLTEMERDVTVLDPSELVEVTDDDDTDLPTFKRTPPPPPPPRRSRSGEVATKTLQTGAIIPTPTISIGATQPAAARSDTLHDPQLEVESPDHVKLPLIIEYDENGKEMIGGRCPLHGERQVFTIGTDIQNDIVITEDYGRRIDPFHAELKIEDGKIFIRGRAGGGPLKLLKPGERQLVVSDWRQIDEEQPFMVGRFAGKDESDLPRFAVRLDQQVEKKPFAEYLRNRFKMLIQEHAHEVLLLLTREKDKKGAKGPDNNKGADAEARIASLTASYKQILADAAKYKLELFRQVELADVIKLARDPIYEWMSSRLYAMIQKYGQDLLALVESQREHITKDGKPEDLNMSLDLPAEFHEILGMSNQYAIDVMTDAEIQEQIDEATAKAKEAASDMTSRAQARIHAESVRTAQELARSFKPIEDHQVALREFQQQYAGVHYLENMEMLDANTQFGYVGPVIRVEDTYNFKETVPFILNRVSLGEHPINTIELPKVVDRKRGTKPFMVEIERNPKTGAFIVHWMDGNVEYSTKETPITPTFEIPFGQQVRIGRYTVSIEDHHAYTDKAIKGVAGQQGEELMEIIFDQWFSSQERNEEAYEQLKEMAHKKYVDLAAVRQGMTLRMVKLWEEIGSWKPNLPLRPQIDTEDNSLTHGSRCIQDAQHLITLNALLADRGLFLEKIDAIYPAKIKDAARTRMHAYIAAHNEAAAVPPLSLRSVVLSLKKKYSPDSPDVTESERRRTDAMQRAEIGKIQIARFLAAGFVTEDDVNNNANISPEYLLKIQEVVKIRGLFDTFQKGGEGVDAIDELTRLCEGKKMKDVFSTDEILIANLNIELNLDEEYPLTKYLHKLAGFVAREAFRSAMEKPNNSNELTTLKKLFDLKVVTVMDLRTPPLLTPDLIEAQLEELFMSSQHTQKQVERERKLKLRKYEILEREAAQLDVKRRALVEKADKVGDALELGRVETKLEVLLEVADILNDPEVDTEMEEERVSLQMFRFQHDLRHGREAFRDRMEAIVAERRTITWQDMKKEYRELAHKAGLAAAKKVADGEDAAYNHLLLKKAAAKGIVDLTDLGLDDAKIQQGRNAEQAKLKQAKFEKKYASQFEQMSLVPLEDFSCFDAFDMNAITDEDEKMYVKGLIDRICIDKMGVILENLWNGKDIVYMKLVAKKLIRKGFNAEKYFPATELALLQ